MNKINENVEFQNEAISKLKKRIRFALDSDGDIKEFNFKSCVASGKTVMCARLMKDLFLEDEYKSFAFVWNRSKEEARKNYTKYKRSFNR